MEPRFHLRCLGEPTLIGPDGQPVRFKVRKHLALLVYLAVESRARHRREHLADLLWANLPEPDGRHSLATALSTLRARFGREVVESSRDDLRWAYTRLDLDLDRLVAGEVLGNDFLPPLEVAGFLDGFEVPGAAEFMLWRERQRARWLPLVRDALVVLIDRCRRTGDFRQIEQLADRMLRLDDLSEEAIRAKMEARAFAGDRLTALKIFEGWAERLDEELGAAPSALLDGMALRLRKRGWERSPTSGIPSVRTEQWKDRPFVGRTSEYRTLYEGWERTQRGEPGHVVVLGESGIGKSTLVERLATAAGLEGAAVSRVQCYDLEREIPYAAVSGLVRGLLDRPGASAAPPEALAELARTVSEVRRRFPNIPAAPESEGETARIRLTEAMHQLVASVADEHPVILVVDDHHLADDASLAVLHLVMRRAVGQQIMVVLVARPSEMGASPQAVRLRESLPRLGATPVELPPMTESECAELLASLIPSGDLQPSGAARRALLRAARGYPMVLELLCRDWQEHGERSLALALEAMTVDPATPGAPAEAYRQLLDRIVVALDPTTRNVLNLSAILGHRLNDVAMYGLVDLTVGQTMTGMSRLTELRVLRDGGNGLEFINELIRVQAYMNVPSTMRKVLHAHIADRLIEHEAHGREVAGLEIAWHCIRCGKAELGTPYLLKGAAQAMQRGAPHEAELALTSGLSTITAEHRGASVILLAETLLEQGEWNRAAMTLDGVAEGDPIAVGERAYVLRQFARHHVGLIGEDNAGDALRGLCETVSSGADVEVRALAARVAARIATLDGSRRDVEQVLRWANTIPDIHLGLIGRITLSYTKGMLHAFAGQPMLSRECVVRGIEQAELGGTANMVTIDLYNGLAAIQCSRANYAEALDASSRAYQMSVRLGNEYVMSAAAANLALCYGRLGQYRDQITWADVVLNLLESSPFGYQHIKAALYKATGHALGGSRDAALWCLDWVDQRMHPSSSLGLQQAWMLSKADILQLLCKNGAAAVAGGQATRGRFAEVHAKSLTGSFARWVVTTADTAEQLAFADETLHRLSESIEEFDYIDQIEILGASIAVRRRNAKKRGLIREERALAERVTRLPPATARQLILLGAPLSGARPAQPSRSDPSAK